MITKCDNIYIVYICYMYWYEMFYIIKTAIKSWVRRCLLSIVLILYNIIDLFFRFRDPHVLLQIHIFWYRSIEYSTVFLHHRFAFVFSLGWISISIALFSVLDVSDNLWTARRLHTEKSVPNHCKHQESGQLLWCVYIVLCFLEKIYGFDINAKSY